MASLQIDAAPGPLVGMPPSEGANKRTAGENPDAATEPKRSRPNGETTEGRQHAASNGPVLRFRSWAAGEPSPAPAYTLCCTYGDPDDPLPSCVKSKNVAWIRSELEERGLDTSGTKAVLLDRLRAEVPSVTFKIDGRECLQRVVNAMLHSFGWDNTHMFSAKFPARGTVGEGRGIAADACGFDLAVLFCFGDWWREFGLDTTPYDWPPLEGKSYWPRRLRHWDVCRGRGRLTWREVRDIALDPKAPGPVRTLKGSAFDPLSDSGARYSLQELELKRSDTIRVRYDFEGNHNFKITVKEVVPDTLLEEKDMYTYPTRFEFLTKGKCHIQPQYQREMN
mmetsp:Transcript_2606/g.6789  ORF Transcript_2606/g.6789 Transcript_2606/m.6789 type:complete len:337 (-) Transcript_2606:295-1305(-)